MARRWVISGRRRPGPRVRDTSTSRVSRHVGKGDGCVARATRGRDATDATATRRLYAVALCSRVVVFLPTSYGRLILGELASLSRRRRCRAS